MLRPILDRQPFFIWRVADRRYHTERVLSLLVVPHHAYMSGELRLRSDMGWFGPPAERNARTRAGDLPRIFIPTLAYSYHKRKEVGVIFHHGCRFAAGNYGRTSCVRPT